MSVSVVAQPPFQTSQDNVDSLTVINLKNDFISYGTNFSLDVHVANSSSGVLNNSEFDCVIHVYNNDGVHIIEDYMLKDDNEYDVYYVINSSSTSFIGDIPFTIFCNSSSGEYGFLSAYSYVSLDGNDPSVTNKSLWFIIIFVIIFDFVLMLFYYVFKNQRDYIGLIAFPLIITSVFWIGSGVLSSTFGGVFYPISLSVFKILGKVTTFSVYYLILVLIYVSFKKAESWIGARK